MTVWTPAPDIWGIQTQVRSLSIRELIHHGNWQIPRTRDGNEIRSLRSRSMKWSSFYFLLCLDLWREEWNKTRIEFLSAHPPCIFTMSDSPPTYDELAEHLRNNPSEVAKIYEAIAKETNSDETRAKLKDEVNKLAGASKQISDSFNKVSIVLAEVDRNEYKEDDGVTPVQKLKPGWDSLQNVCYPLPRDNVNLCWTRMLAMGSSLSAL